MYTTTTIFRNRSRKARGGPRYLAFSLPRRLILSLLCQFCFLFPAAVCSFIRSFIHCPHVKSTPRFAPSSSSSSSICCLSVQHLSAAASRIAYMPHLVCTCMHAHTLLSLHTHTPKSKRVPHLNVFTSPVYPSARCCRHRRCRRRRDTRYDAPFAKVKLKICEMMVVVVVV
ncbi:hypothetical protein IWZ03DRAFT_385878 [Phyllosticta citriasiana]|uniref:Uncharacterized protein n=1 Tax=Phyllosticta citriasiana TaxID=595635 RepID=A0ABR1KF39_9PEZI